jgi:hypothetical protein
VTPKDVSRISNAIGSALHDQTIEVAMAALVYSIMCVLRQVDGSGERKLVIIHLISELIEEAKLIDKEEEPTGPKNAATPWGYR